MHSTPSSSARPAPSPPARSNPSSSARPTPSARPPRFPKYINDAAASVGVHYSELEVTEESRFSCLMPYQFSQVSAAYSAEMGAAAPRTIVDATANIGCDTIQLRRMFPGAQITALEIDPPTASLLAKNMAKLGRILPRQAPLPVFTFNVDGVAYLGVGAGAAAPVQADLVYFDAPWGGPGYHKTPAFDLMLSGCPLGDVVGRTLLRVAPLVVVKMPVNANFEAFRAQVGAHTSAAYTFHDVCKPKGNAKGTIAYRLAFIRRDKTSAGVNEPDGADEPDDTDEPDGPRDSLPASESDPPGETAPTGAEDAEDAGGNDNVEG